MLNMDNPLEHESAGDTTGIRLQTRNTVLADSVELLSSMRFAISLLVLICIGAVIGTVVKQNEPARITSISSASSGMKCLILPVCIRCIPPGGFC
jgi:hypothetical protein